jgi:hypothetical protein
MQYSSLDFDETIVKIDLPQGKEIFAMDVIDGNKSNIVLIDKSLIAGQSILDESMWRIKFHLWNAKIVMPDANLVEAVKSSLNIKDSNVYFNYMLVPGNNLILKVDDLSYLFNFFNHFSKSVVTISNLSNIKSLQYFSDIYRYHIVLFEIPHGTEEVELQKEFYGDGKCSVERYIYHICWDKKDVTVEEL